MRESSCKQVSCMRSTRAARSAALVARRMLEICLREDGWKGAGVHFRHAIQAATVVVLLLEPRHCTDYKVTVVYIVCQVRGSWWNCGNRSRARLTGVTQSEERQIPPVTVVWQLALYLIVLACTKVHNGNTHMRLELRSGESGDIHHSKVQLHVWKSAMIVTCRRYTFSGAREGKVQC